MADNVYPFYVKLAKILNSGQSRSVILCGNVYDLFYNGREHVPLVSFLADKCRSRGIVRIVYELNGPVRILDDRADVKSAWIAWKSGIDPDTLLLRGMAGKGPSEADRLGGQFERLLLDAIGNPNLALELLRQLTVCARSSNLAANLVVFIEAADMLLPAGNGDIAALNERQLHRISVVQDWFCDPAFANGRDSVCLIAESRSLVHPRVSRLPQVLPVEIPAPSTADRLHYIETFLASASTRPKLWSTPAELASLTAGLSVQALRQILLGSAYTETAVTPADVVAKVEEFIQGQLGEDVVEFAKPTHTLGDVVGYCRLKEFFRDEFLPRIRAGGDKALSGAAVAGPIGSGKTFILEAVAGELDLPVLVLKGIRSQWYGQTDVIFERFRRTVEALDRVLIFVDEADTQFGGVGADAHETERRLTGKVQAMMSNPALRGKVTWLLITARIHLLSPDIRRPGRAGDLVIPILDPEGSDRREFIAWTLKGFLDPANGAVDQLDQLTRGYSAAAFASLRQHLKAKGAADLKQVVEIVRDQISPAIGLTRRYQTLQALVNCTRRRCFRTPTCPIKTARRGRSRFANWRRWASAEITVRLNTPVRPGSISPPRPSPGTATSCGRSGGPRRSSPC